MTEPTTTIPESPSALNLDALEREGAPGPFTFVHSGREYTLRDPEDIDWQDLISAMSDGIVFLRLALPEQDRESFFASKLPSWKLKALMKAYNEHYGIADPPNAGVLPTS